MSAHTKLNSDYAFKENEEYAIEIDELSFNNREYSSVIWQSTNTVFINGTPMEEYADKYCGRTKHEEAKTHSFRLMIK